VIGEDRVALILAIDRGNAVFYFHDTVICRDQRALIEAIRPGEAVLQQCVSLILGRDPLIMDFIARLHYRWLPLKGSIRIDI
jgi:hypothetical protein